ncbi:MAG: acetylxylan esterase [Lentisphaeria bacterium]
MRIWSLAAARLAGVLAACAAGVSGPAAPMESLSLVGATDKAPVSYRAGEPMTFKIQLLKDGRPLAGKTLRWSRTGDDQQTGSGEAVSSATQPVLIKTAIGQPGFVRLEVTAFNPDGSPLRDGAGNPLKFDGGAGAAPEKLVGYPEPADFDAFWRAQRARLAKVPMQARLQEVPPLDPAFRLFDVRVDCAGGRPVSGYLAVPKGAKPKSLPAQVLFHGYGVGPAEANCHRAGMLTFDLNAHGIENGRDPAYYQALRDGELAGYAFHDDTNAKPETAYFNGMMLRAMRALEFIKSRPEWDGRALMVCGGSQGGLQALNAAALDHDVTRCDAGKPWCCDLGSVTLGRLGGWRPSFADGLGYYDPVNQARRISCETVITAGLGDYVCPPSGLSILYNNLKGPKMIEYIQGSTHGYDPPAPQRQTVIHK